MEVIRTKYANMGAANIHVMTIGKKSNAFFTKQACTVDGSYVHLLQTLTFEETAKAAEYVINAFISGQFDVVELVYAQFKNAGVQNFMAEPFLPLVKQPTDLAPTTNVADFIFEPNKEEIIEVLIPKILKTQFFKALLDTNASEHGARMTAMDKATDNAQELLKELGISYNRARQAAITTELTEIVSGAAALEGN
jgi:F-type H+-transporting ATPase subunit gamma